MKQRLKSFQYAGQGLVTFLRTQPNAWIHALATVVVIIMGIFFSISRMEWVGIIMAIGLVWVAESFNTAIEFLADEVTQEKRELIGKAKDVAACGVLFASLIALLVGIAIFWPYLVSF
ncbi:MAG: diacylglycerol kinase family protein [Verrucomicrobiae bacterium]|nr:diacylglycerol kinase family protein [Verrucomicrobiae bacterium]